MKAFLIVAIMCGLNAQDFDHRDRDHERSEKQDFDNPDREHERSDKMEMMMVWKLTEELALSPEQAENSFQDFGNIVSNWMKLKKWSGLWERK